MTTNTLAAIIAVLAAVLFLGGAVFLIANRIRQNRPRRAARSPSHGIRTDEQIDEYHLVRRIHDGQNSRVWEVFDEVSEEHLAMKILTDANARDKHFRKALRHEWEVARRLDHPNVIGCDRFVEDQDTAYIIMELFVSRNIKERILSRQKDFLARHARGIMQQTAEALAAIHTGGWVHRDVKPANILVNSDGEVRLIDFGLAEPSVSRWQRLLPRRRVAQGTISYMSPEQIRGERVDARADIYCLGATFYEMVTGRPPLVGQTRSDLLQKHLTEPPRPATALNADLSDEFAALLQWMLEKRPEHRPPQVDVVLLRLQETPLLRGEPVPNGS
jgi:eukaryotic-like serine/threonine-protein kinase